MKALNYIFALLVLVSCNTAQQGVDETSGNGFTNESSYEFEGSEPFWSMKIERDSVFLEMFNVNKTDRLKVSFAQKTHNGNSQGFTGDGIYGVIRETETGFCNLAVTEVDSLGYEIFFTYEEQTYQGCGTIVPD